MAETYPYIALAIGLACGLLIAFHGIMTLTGPLGTLGAAIVGVLMILPISLIIGWLMGLVWPALIIVLPIIALRRRQRSLRLRAWR